MKTIVNVKITSVMSIYNGLTFEVINVTDKTVCLNINNVETDFTHKEVFIVDIKKEIDQISKKVEIHQLPKDNLLHTNLIKYAIHNNITL
jgi:hypothetical protein